METLIAKHLLDIKAVFLRPSEPFTWASGIKSPIYCDNRLTLSYPKVRTDIENGLATLIKEHFPECECLMGTATAGIAHAAIVGDILELPMGYVRGGTKDHGRNNQIEGVIKPGMKVVVIEDLISTGGSSLECVEVLRNAGCTVLGMAAIFTYGLQKGIDAFAKANCPLVTLTNYDHLIKIAVTEKYIQENEILKLELWKKNPSDESWLTK